MTTKTHESGQPTGEFYAWLNSCVDHSPGTERRWRLLTRRYHVSPQLHIAVDNFHYWSEEAWREARRDREGLLAGRAPLDRWSPGWAWFRMGGAWTFLRDQALPKEDLPRFIALTGFMHYLNVSAGDARRTRAHLSRMQRFPHRRPVLAAIRSCGTRHAAWWLARHRQINVQPLMWNALERKEVPTLEPARFIDVAAGEWHRICGKRH